MKYLDMLDLPTKYLHMKYLDMLNLRMKYLHMKHLDLHMRNLMLI